MLSRLLKGCLVEDLTETRARLAGATCARAGTTDVVDASIVVGAAARQDLVVTGDPDDLRQLIRTIGGNVHLHVV